MARLMNELKIGAVPHGFQSSFREELRSARTLRAMSASSPWRTATATASTRSNARFTYNIADA